MKKISDTLWIHDHLKLAIVQPMDRSDWIVLNNNTAVIFGPNTFKNCKQFVESKIQ